MTSVLGCHIITAVNSLKMLAAMLYHLKCSIPSLVPCIYTIINAHLTFVSCHIGIRILNKRDLNGVLNMACIV